MEPGQEETMNYLSNYLLVGAGIIAALCVAAVLLDLAGRAWYWIIDRYSTR